MSEKYFRFFIIFIFVSAGLLALPASARAGDCFDSFSVSPAASNDDELMKNSNASWEFSLNNATTTSGGLSSGDEVRIDFPDISEGSPFDFTGLNATSTGVTISNTTLSNDVVSFTLGSDQGSGGPFTLTLNGVGNAAGPLTDFQNMSWWARAFDSNGNPIQVGGGDCSSVSATQTIGRKGKMIPYNPDFSFSADDYSTDTSAKYTLSFKAPTALFSGDKIAWRFPSSFDVSNATTTTELADLTQDSATTSPQVSSLEVLGGEKLIRFPLSNGSTSADDIVTIAVENVVNPTDVGAHQGFAIYTTTGENGVIDGLPAASGIEPSRMGPPLLESVMIGGTNSITFTVQKEDSAGNVNNLTSSETDLVKVGLACPDKRYFVGTKYVDRDTSQVTFGGLLDCNYIAFTEPAQMPQPDQEVDDDFKDFFDNYLEPAKKEVPVSGDDSVSANLTFLVPDSYITGSITGGVADSQEVELMAFSGTHMSWAPVVKDTNDYSFDNAGLDSSGNGYFKIKVASGETWQLNLELLGTGGVISDGSSEYWPPDLGSVYIPDGTSSKDIGSNSFMEANKDLKITLEKSTGGSITDACVAVRRSGLGFMMGPGEDNCSPNPQNEYAFKVPKGSLSVEVMQPGRGKPKSFPVYMKASDSSKTKNLVLESPDSYIQGTVTDSSNNTISNATIFAHSSTGGYGEAMTDSSGNYQIYVPEGTYTVEGFAPGFGDLTRKTGVTVSGSTNPTENFTVNLGDFKTIEGRVYTDANDNSGYDDDTDTPYEGVQIFGYGPDGSNGTVTLSDGSYSLRVPEGTYTVEGWSDATGELKAKTGIDVSSGSQKGKDWLVEGMQTLQVEIAGGSGISPIFAEAFNTSTGSRNHIDEWSTDGSEDKTGTMQVPGGSTYEVMAGSPGFGEIGSSSSVDPSGSGSDVTFTLPTTGTLSGSVTTSGGSSIEDAVVWAARIGGPGYFSTTTDSSGDYSMSLPTDRNYDIGVDMGGYLSSITTVNGFSSGDTTDFSLTEAGAAISGTVTSDGSTGIQDGMVWAEKTTGSGWTASPTNDDGTYSLDVDDGTWKVFADGPCYEKSGGLSVSAGTSSANITLTAVSGCTPPTPNIQTVVPSTGGTVYNDADGDGSPDIEISFPANALGTGNTPVTVSIKKEANPVSTLSNTPLPNAVQDVTITDSSGSLITSLNSKATVTIYYDESGLPEGFNESELQFAQWNSSTKNWDPVATTVDTDNNKLTAKVEHFSPAGGGLGSVPAAPEGVSASASSNTVTVSWNEVSNATSYKVYRSPNSGGTYSSLATPSSTSYTDNGLSYSTPYYYKVSAVNDSGEGSKSSEVSATTGSGGGGGAFLVQTCGDQATEDGCLSQDCYWYNSSCHNSEPACSDYTSENECTGTDCFWYEESCHPGERTVEEEVEQEVEEEAEQEIELPTWEKPVSEMSKPELVSAIEEVEALIRELQADLRALTGGVEEVPAGFAFGADLERGMSGPAVKHLQIVLNSDPETQLAEKGVGSPGEETNYFGPLTEQAVIEFQEKYAEEVLGPWDIDEGTGLVGTTTREKLNEIVSP